MSVLSRSKLKFSDKESLRVELFLCTISQKQDMLHLLVLLILKERERETDKQRFIAATPKVIQGTNVFFCFLLMFYNIIYNYKCAIKINPYYSICKNKR